MKKTYLTTAPAQTQKLGTVLGKRVLEISSAGKAVVIGLEGNLGGGKTTFLQGFAKGLGIKEKINSPTFVILKRFKIKNSKFKNFYHLDCYRIKTPKELLDLGFERVIADSQSIVAVEWAERIKKIMPKGSTSVKFYFVDKLKRRIVITLNNERKK
ncbi:MAG: tRNA (adenosine(37)-N6)-threonylcarbamoyltransferase complex ATPase subunit type 1 TsaE [bacterium]|nr:tRNA (adenosine(37)-N6)-threonylcarbamoyltransferase complex ATPase subunit type 1 TsaE [bacterium]